MNVIDAVCMRLSAGIEALAALDPKDREEIFGEVWPLMWGMRNRIAHGYLLVDSAIIRETLVQDVPSILSRIRLRVVDQPAAMDDDQSNADASESDRADIDVGIQIR